MATLERRLAQRLDATRKGRNVDNQILQAALEYHARAWSIIPMRMGARKNPAVKWGPYQINRADESQLGEWFGNGSCFGLAVVFGTISGGLGIRDFDTMDSYNCWAAENPKLAKTLPTVATSRGRHVYFNLSQEQETSVREALCKPGGTGAIPFEDGELRIGVGAYAVLPPSPHPNGGKYIWLIPPTEEIQIVDVREAGFLKGSLCNRDSGRHQRQPKTLITPKKQICEPLIQRPLLSPLSLLQAVEAAIERTLPTGNGQRHGQLFAFARALKGIPELFDVEVSAIKPYVKLWHDRALPFIGTKAWEETWWDIAESWDKIIIPAGKGIEMLLEKVLVSELPAEAAGYDQPELRVLVGLCRELQRASGPDRPFFLSCRTGGRLLKTDHVTVSRWLKGLQVDQIIKLVEAGSAGTRKAHRYRYLKEL